MTDPQLYLTVAVPTPVRREFQYLPPAGDDPASYVRGARVCVPFGRQKVIGFLTGVSHETRLDTAQLRRAERILDLEPVLGGQLQRLCNWAAEYYHHPVGEVISAALPALIRHGESISHQERRLALTEAGRGITAEQLARAPRQREIVAGLKERDSPLPAADLERGSYSDSALRQLLAKGLVEWRLHAPPSRERVPTGMPLRGRPLALNAEQQAAFELIAGLSDEEPGCVLLQGVTGSGKTEIYLQLIQRVLEAGRQALVLVPEISLTPQTVNRFRERFRARVDVLHSGLTDRERLDAWRAARSGESAIVIGTRSAIFTPLAGPGVIIVDEEHDHSFKQQEGFRYSARDLAVMRGHMEGVPVLLGSATPSLESLYNAMNGRYGWARLTHRAGGAAEPAYRLLDIRTRPLDEGFSAPLVKLIGEHLIRGNQVMVFVNRRGFAPTLLCHQCGWMAVCGRCDARLTLHLLSNSLQCHHCGHRRAIDNACPQCGAAQLSRLGVGTERTERTLRRLFPDQRVIRVDRDTVRRRNAMADLVEEIEKGGSAILVGTQLLAKGHHFPHLTLVAVLDADAGFFSSDFRAVETTGQLLLQVTGRTGRWEKEGEAVIQTHFPDHPLLRDLTVRGYASFAERLLGERRAFGLPPFGHLVLIRAEAQRQELPLAFLEQVAAVQRKAAAQLDAGDLEILGPIPSAMEKRAGRFRAQLLVQSPQRPGLHNLLDMTIPAMEELKLARRVRWSIDVDPLDTI